MSKVKQVLRLHTQGVSNRRIALDLGLYKGTVNSYIRKIKGKHSVMPVFDSMIFWSTKVDFQKPPKHSELMWNFQEFLLE